MVLRLILPLCFSFRDAVGRPVLSICSFRRPVPLPVSRRDDIVCHVDGVVSCECLRTTETFTIILMTVNILDLVDHVRLWASLRLWRSAIALM